MIDEPLDARPLLLRQLTLDFTPGEKSDEICAWLGLTPEAPDVSAAEHQDSRERLGKCQALMPQIEICTGLLALIVKTVASREDPGANEEQLEMFARQFHTATGSAIYTVLAQLFNNGSIQYGRAIMPPQSGMLM
jgi:hypothetical protein